ncbi:MAG: hypothetical protein DI565_18180 [Ancylobacter novellus]|uniref:Uncharacterized protein n=1 Tax=Ancylobacter novellus TaxID=921 RepID=A0A2W5K5J0_ANCNO|nr:MAG: hypothetical protein DI565_18180 [Ancylobacter novellus]
MVHQLHVVAKSGPKILDMLRPKTVEIAIKYFNIDKTVKCALSAFVVDRHSERLLPSIRTTERGG